MKKVFVASSGDLYDERMKLKLLLHEIGVEPVLWEYTDQSITDEEFQKRLNKDLANSNIVIFMVRSRFGQYTKEEFDFAYARLGKGIEKIYVYFFEQKSEDIDEEDLTNITSFRDSIEKKKSIYKDVKNFTELENHIRQQKEYWNLYQEDNRTIQSLKNREIYPSKMDSLLTFLSTIFLPFIIILVFLSTLFSFVYPSVEFIDIVDIFIVISFFSSWVFVTLIKRFKGRE